jgi:hypothetical protein
MISFILLPEFGYAGISAVAMLAAKGSADLYLPTSIDPSSHGWRY